MSRSRLLPSLRRLRSALSALFAGSREPVAGGQRPLSRTLPPAQAGDRILIVAPHIDDEAIAAAGYLTDAKEAGAEVWIAYLTAGDGGQTVARIGGRTLRPHAADFLREGDLRIDEAHRAAERMGVPRDHLFLLGYPDGDLGTLLERPEEVITSRATREQAVPYPSALSPGAPYRLRELERDLDSVLAAVEPTRVLGPVPFDSHADHAAGGRVLLERLARRRSVSAAPERHAPAPQWLGFLVHAPGFPRPFRLRPRAPLQPPVRWAESDRIRGIPWRWQWRTYPLSPGAESRKQAVLEAYSSQREDPYLRLLLDAFVRTNELFLVSGDDEA